MNHPVYGLSDITDEILKIKGDNIDNTHTQCRGRLGDKLTNKLHEYKLMSGYSDKRKNKMQSKKSN